MTSAKHKVLIAAAIYPPDPGGPATHAKSQYEGFPALGIETRLSAYAHFRWLPKGLSHLAFLIALLVKGLGADLIYAHDATSAGLPALKAARLMGKKIIIRIGGDVAWERAADQNETSLSMTEWYERGIHKGNRLFKISQSVIAGADEIVVTSKLLSDLYVKYYGVSMSKIHVIPNPVPKTDSVPIRDDKTIIYASRLVSYKNLHFVIRVLAKIFPEYPDLKFIIMGDGPERTRLENTARELGVIDRVIFLGSVPHKEMLQNAASCSFAIAPALTEFNPNYILESISFGKPFLMSRENGVPFPVPGDLLFDPRSEEELRTRLLNLLNPESYKTLQDQVRSIDFHMSWDDNLRANAELIKSL